MPKYSWSDVEKNIRIGGIFVLLFITSFTEMAYFQSEAEEGRIWLLSFGMYDPNLLDVYNNKKGGGRSRALGVVGVRLGMFWVNQEVLPSGVVAWC